MGAMVPSSDAASNSVAEIDGWLDASLGAMRARADELPGQQGKTVAAGLARFAEEKDPLEAPTAISLQVVDEFLASRAGAARVHGLPLSTVFGALRWEPTQRASDGGTEFGLAVLTDLLGLDATQAGIMVVGPGCQYPVHHHARAEAYLVLHGVGQWRFGGSEEYVSVEPGEIVVNEPNDTHSAIAGDEPIAALYILW